MDSPFFFFKWKLVAVSEDSPSMMMMDGQWNIVRVLRFPQKVLGSSFPSFLSSSPPLCGRNIPPTVPTNIEFHCDSSSPSLLPLYFKLNVFFFPHRNSLVCSHLGSLIRGVLTCNCTVHEDCSNLCTSTDFFPWRFFFFLFLTFFPPRL